MDKFEKHTESPNPSMLVDFESMLAQSKRDQFLWTALSAVIFTLIVIAWPVGLGPLDTSADIVWLFARGLLPVVLCLSLPILLVWIHLRMEAILQRGLNEQPTAEIIDLTSNLRGGDAKRLAADLLWLRAAFGTDHQARTFLAGDDWHDHPPTPYIPYDELAAKRPRSRVRFITIVLLASGVSMVATFLEDLRVRGHSRFVRQALDHSSAWVTSRWGPCDRGSDRVSLLRRASGAARGQEADPSASRKLALGQRTGSQSASTSCTLPPRAS